MNTPVELPISSLLMAAPEPLTDWENPPTAQNMKNDLMEAKSSHDKQKEKINRWLDNLNVTGSAKPKDVKNRSSIQPKLIRKQAEWRYGALSEPFLSTDDLFNVTPVTWEDKKAAEQNQLLLNHQFNNGMDKVSFIDEYVRAATDEGTVIVRTGWEFEEQEVEEEVPIVTYKVNPEFQPMHEYLMQLKQESPSQYATDVPEELKTAHDLTMEQGRPIEPVITGKEMKKVMKTLVNRPTAHVCDIRNIIVAPNCLGDIEKAGFVIYSFESSVAELKKDKRYKNLDLIEASSNSPLAEPDHTPRDGSHNFNFADKPRTQFVVYEYWGYWDIDGTETLKPIVASWVGNVMIRMEMNPYPDRAHPFVTAQYLPVRRSIYGEPDGELLEDNQKVIGAVTRGMIDIMGRSANGQTGIRKDMLDQTNKRKFDRGDDYEFNANVDPRQGVHMHVYPEIPQSAQFMLMAQQNEAESMTGVKAYSQGVSGQGLGDVAAGVRGALDAASKRELGILRRLSNGIVKVGRKFMAMNAVFLSDEEVVRITNDEFVKIRRDDLAGKFDLKLSISTAEEDNNKAEELGFMLQTIGPNMDPAMSRMVLSDIAKLRKMPDLAKKIQDYQPQPDPMQQQIQQLEIEKLQAEIAEIKGRTIRHQTGAELDMAKVGTEGAKATNLQSDADIKNLDFVEQESGTKQERDLQKIGEQARSQAKLRAVDHEYTLKEKKVDLLKDYLVARKK